MRADQRMPGCVHVCQSANHEQEFTHRASLSLYKPDYIVHSNVDLRVNMRHNEWKPQRLLKVHGVPTMRRCRCLCDQSEIASGAQSHHTGYDMTSEPYPERISMKTESYVDIKTPFDDSMQHSDSRRGSVSIMLRSETLTSNESEVSIVEGSFALRFDGSVKPKDAMATL